MEKVEIVEPSTEDKVGLQQWQRTCRIVLERQFIATFGLV
jgi:hypothetical protein